jgi:C-terminal processing protease CtpA/Prc
MRSSSAHKTPTGNRFTTIVAKGNHGIGLDLVKSQDGGTFVQRVKDMPFGVANPASSAIPPVLAGDFILGVNGKLFEACFADVVREIRSSVDKVELLIERFDTTTTVP